VCVCVWVYVCVRVYVCTCVGGCGCVGVLTGNILSCNFSNEPA
jgi:hypothetical protein